MFSYLGLNIVVFVCAGAFASTLSRALLYGALSAVTLGILANLGLLFLSSTFAYWGYSGDDYIFLSRAENPLAYVGLREMARLCFALVVSAVSFSIRTMYR